MVGFGAVATFIGSILVVLPRCALITREVFIDPIVSKINADAVTATTGGGSAVAIIFIAVFFAIALFCAIRPSKVVDVVGKYLTPALLVILVVLFIVGISKVGSTGARAEDLTLQAKGFGAFAFGIQEGLQTFDAATGTIIAVIIVTALLGYNINKVEDQTKTIIKSGFVAAICLIIIYLGLALLGLLYSNDPALVEAIGANPSRTALLNYIMQQSLGFGGTIIFGITCFLATLTTSIGCLGLTAMYYSKITKNKLSYKNATIACVVIALAEAIYFSTRIGGVDELLKYTLPILAVTAPISVVCIVLNLFTKKIKNDNVWRGAMIAAGIWGLMYGLALLFSYSTATAASPYGLAGHIDETGMWINDMPGFFNLYAAMFGHSIFDIFGLQGDNLMTYFTTGVASSKALSIGSWNIIFKWVGDLGYIIPAVVGGLIGALIKKGGYSPRPYLRENDTPEINNMSYEEAVAAIKAK